MKRNMYVKRCSINIGSFHFWHVSVLSMHDYKCLFASPQKVRMSVCFSMNRNMYMYKCGLHPYRKLTWPFLPSQCSFQPSKREISLRCIRIYKFRGHTFHTVFLHLTRLWRVSQHKKKKRIKRLVIIHISRTPKKNWGLVTKLTSCVSGKIKSGIPKLDISWGSFCTL